MPDLISDLTAAADAVGPEKIGIIFGIAMVPWESAQQRDDFLTALTGPSGYFRHDYNPLAEQGATGVE